MNIKQTLEKFKKILNKQIKITEVEEIKEFIKDYKSGDKNYKDKLQVLLLIFFVPILLFFADYSNILTIVFPNIRNLNINFDWLSFAGAYGGAIVSAILLIFITQNDRAENTKVLRESQRPYLEVSSNIIRKVFLDKINNDKVIVYNHGEILDLEVNKYEYLVLEIKNKGQSVAILDVNETVFDLIYTSDDKKNVIEREIKVEIKLNEIFNRYSLSPGETIIIKFCKLYLYDDKYCVKNSSQIVKTQVYYKDLFEKKYVDECEYKDGNWLPVRDNKII